MSRFQTTRWSLIDAARDEPARARDALEQLCRAYRPPVLSYLRHSGYSVHDAEDITQAFFVGFLERRWYTDADPQRGRFRSLLLTSLRHFLADQHAHGHAAKRHGHCVGDGMLESVPDTGDSPEQAFTRAWLGTVIAHAMTRLQAEWVRAGKRAQFDQLAPLLIESPEPAALHDLAEQLGTRANTLAVQTHRMRGRLRQLVRLELMQTVGSPEALELELAELRGALEPARPAAMPP